MRLIAGTSAINTEEPCLSLAEVDLPGKPGQGVRRTQVIYVMRGDTPTEFRRDLGPASSFKQGQFRIPGGIYDEADRRYYVEHNVGELIDIAEHLRSDRFQPPPRPEPHDLITAFKELPERRAALRLKRSQFGRLHKIQRD